MVGKKVSKNAENRAAAKLLRKALAAKSTRVPRSIPGPWPQKRSQKLRYFDSIVLNAGAGAITSHLFRANSLFDPDYTGIGHQPRGFDQWMAMYQKFVVVSSRIKIMATYSAGGNASIIFILPTFGTSIPAFALEDQQCKWTTVVGGDSPVTLWNTYSHRNEFKSNPIDDDLAHGTASADPGKIFYYHIGQAALNGAQDPGDITLNVQMDYQVTFFEPVIANSS